MIKRIGVLITACVLSVIAFGQARVLTFNDVVKIALRNGMLINQQKNNLEYNLMLRNSSVVGLGPTLGFQANGTRIYGNTFNQNKGIVVNGELDNVNASMNAGISIFGGFAQVNRIKQNQNLLDAQSYYVNRTAQDIINTVGGQYLQVLLDIELLRIARENLEVLRKTLSQVKEQVSLGAKAPVDEYNQDSQTKAAEIKALQAEIALINDKSLLTLSLLLDPTEDFELEKPIWEADPSSVEKIQFDQLVDQALKSRGDYIRAQKQENAARFGMNAFRGSLMPSLTAGYTIYSAYNNVHGDINKPFDHQMTNDNLRKFVGFSLNIPVLGGNFNLQNRTLYIQQRVLYENAQLTRKNAEIQVRTDVLRNYQNYRLYAETYKLTQAQLNAAQMAFELESERYNLGVTNFVDFSNSNKVLVQAQTDKSQAEFRLLFQRVLMDYAVGTLKIDEY